MSTENRPLRHKVMVRRRMTLILGVSIIVGCVVALVAVGVVSSRWIEARENMHVSLYGAGVERLQPGDQVVVGVQQIGHVRAVNVDGGRVEAHLVLKRRDAEQIAGTSEFRVESLNDWFPGNLGVRIRAPERSDEYGPLRDRAQLRAADSFLPPEIPVRFYYLVGAAVLVTAITAGLALAIYRAVCKLTAALIVVAVGALVLVAGYYYFSTLISEPILLPFSGAHFTFPHSFVPASG